MNPARILRFDAADLEGLFPVFGRHDAAAVRLAEDLEACLGAWRVARGSGPQALVPPALDADLVTVAERAAGLRSALYALPDELALLLDLHVLSEGAHRRIAADLEALTVPLEDLAAAVTALRRQLGLGDVASGKADTTWIAAAATAYRNRLNRKPEAEPDGHFLAVLRAVIAAAARRDPQFGALADALTPERVRAALAAPTPRRRSGPEPTLEPLR